MAGQAAVFHALLRPSMLQVLRATGYHATKGAVLDSLTDLAARYLSALCEATAAHAADGGDGAAGFGVADVRLALRDVGALRPGRRPARGRARADGDEADDEDDDDDEGDEGGVDEFLRWFAGPRMRELMEMGRGDGESDATDYLAGLKKKHSKTGDDNRYHGTIIGRAADAACDIQVEGGPSASIDDWVMRRSGRFFAPPPRSPSSDRSDGSDGSGRRAAQANGHLRRRGHRRSLSASSGLSSVGDRLDGDAAAAAAEQGMDLV